LVGHVEECESLKLVEPGESDLYQDWLREEAGVRTGVDVGELSGSEFTYVEGDESAYDPEAGAEEEVSGGS
jgi:hypothetical protein